MAVRTLFYTATKMMKSTCTNVALRAIVGQQTKLCFVSEGNLPLDSFHTRICSVFVLLAKITDSHPRDSLSVAVFTVGLLKCMRLYPLSLAIINGTTYSQMRLDLKTVFTFTSYAQRLTQSGDREILTLSLQHLEIHIYFLNV